MATTQPRYALWHGRNEPPAETQQLRAGPVTALLQGQDLRYIRAGNVEVVRRLYMAVRDQNWNTIPGVASNVQRDIGPDRFSLSFDMRHHQGAVDFSWHGELTGAPDGTITCSLDGVANAAFRYNRIGFCVLHPPSTSAGRPYRAETPNGPISGVLPELIGPQLIKDGTLLALFPAVQNLTIDLAGGVEARFDFEGDLFEMEDQRNWTDNSYKTYSTPLALPWPKDAHAGQVIRQTV